MLLRENVAVKKPLIDMNIYNAVDETSQEIYFEKDTPLIEASIVGVVADGRTTIDTSSPSSEEEKPICINSMMTILTESLGKTDFKKELSEVMTSVVDTVAYAMNSQSVTDTSDILTAITRIEERMEKLQTAIVEQRVLAQKVHKLVLELRDEQSLANKI